MHKVHLERGMLKQQPKLNITGSNKFQVQAQVGQVKSHVIQAAQVIIAELDDHHHFEFDAERLKSIPSLREDNKYHSPVTERRKGGDRRANATHRASIAANGVKNRSNLAVTLPVRVEITLAPLHWLSPDQKTESYLTYGFSGGSALSLTQIFASY
jgi:hypothetical protein